MSQMQVMGVGRKEGREEGLTEGRQTKEQGKLGKTENSEERKKHEHGKQMEHWEN